MKRQALGSSGTRRWLGRVGGGEIDIADGPDVHDDVVALHRRRQRVDVEEVADDRVDTRLVGLFLVESGDRKAVGQQCLETCLPMNPAEPVTNAFMVSPPSEYPTEGAQVNTERDRPSRGWSPHSATRQTASGRIAFLKKIELRPGNQHSEWLRYGTGRGVM